LALRASNIDLNAVATLGTDQALLDLFEAHKHDLFFTKLKDWETEMEYRFLTYWDDPGELYVDVSSALHAIVAGHAVRPQYGPSLRALCNPEGIVLAQMHWETGFRGCSPSRNVSKLAQNDSSLTSPSPVSKGVDPCQAAGVEGESLPTPLAQIPGVD
jgi:hypothetical protein